MCTDRILVRNLVPLQTPFVIATASRLLLCALPDITGHEDLILCWIGKLLATMFCAEHWPASTSTLKTTWHHLAGRDCNHAPEKQSGRRHA